MFLASATVGSVTAAFIRAFVGRLAQCCDACCDQLYLLQFKGSDMFILIGVA